MQKDFYEQKSSETIALDTLRNRVPAYILKAMALIMIQRKIVGSKLEQET